MDSTLTKTLDVKGSATPLRGFKLAALLLGSSLLLAGCAGNPPASNTPYRSRR